MVDPKSVAASFLKQWQAAIHDRQADLLAELFTEDAIFVATAPMPLIGRTEIAAYYRAIPLGLEASADLQVAKSNSPTEVRAVADLHFMLLDRKPIDGRLTLTFVQHRTGAWQVSLYHAALVSPA